MKYIVTAFIVIVMFVSCYDHDNTPIVPGGKIEIIIDRPDWYMVKVRVDSSEYIIVRNYGRRGGVAIIKHK